MAVGSMSGVSGYERLGRKVIDDPLRTRNAAIYVFFLASPDHETDAVLRSRQGIAG